MAYDLTKKYVHLMDELSRTNTPSDTLSSLTAYQSSIYELDLEKRYGEPMFGIGIYIALASLCCIIAMGFDLVYGLRSRKLWFPIKYFRLNAVTLAGITVAMKLPVDLSGSMPGDVDQVTKLGSMAFMCTMMANCLPSLANMNNNELLTNIIALGVLIITLVVNVCIQINSGVVGRIPNDQAIGQLRSEKAPKELDAFEDLTYTTVATIYVTLLLLLLIIHVSSSLGILKSKEIMEPKYKQCHEVASKDFESTGKLLNIEKLQQHVSKYWIMAGSGSPQFISACSATTTASGVICVLTFILHVLTIVWTIIIYIIEGNDDSAILYDSAYKRSTLVIFIVQSIGIVLGTVAPLFRCFASMSFKLSTESMAHHFKVFKVENYWTQKLYDWKYGSISLPLLSISLPFGNHKLKVVIRTLKNLILNICIILQVVVVVVCKIIVLIPFFLTICLHCLKWLFRVMFSSRGLRTNNNLEQHKYVLQLDKENKLAESTLKRLLKSLNGLIQKSEKKQLKNLMKLIREKSTEGFQGVRMFDNNDHHVQGSPSKVEYKDCWSLLVVTLTTIAVTLPNIEKVKVKSLLKSVREGLEYVTLVEETLININDGDYERTQKAAKKLWEEVDFRHKWLGFKLEDSASEVNTVISQVDTTPQIVELFLVNANQKIEEGRGSLDDESKFMSICASSMSRISQAIINNHKSHNELFDELSSRIADIMAACLTNLPQVIAEKCHTSVVEKREASVEAAAKLLGETKQIINTLQGPLQDKWHAYLNMTTDDLPSINKWRAHLSQP